MNKSQKTKVAIIGSVGVPACYGGFETLAHHMVMNLADKLDLTVYCSGKTYKKEQQLKKWNGATLKYVNLEANGVQSVLYDIASILRAIRTNNQLIILGVSGALILPFVKYFTRVKTIINLDGIEWKRNKWGKIASTFLRVSEYLASKFSDKIITDNDALRDYVNDSYQKDSSVIEYGADHAKNLVLNSDHVKKHPFLLKEYAFSVCRIEPENNIHESLKAYSKMPSRQLVFIGNWNNSQYGKDLREEYQKFRNILLLDPIYDQEELDIIRSNANTYIHGHSAGGTNPSLVEAMHLGLAIFSYDVSFNKCTTENQAFYFTDAESLIKQIEKHSKLEMIACGIRLKNIANQRYKWSVIAQKYYREVIILRKNGTITAPLRINHLTTEDELLSKVG